MVVSTLLIIVINIFVKKICYDIPHLIGKAVFFLNWAFTSSFLFFSTFQFQGLLLVQNLAPASNSDPNDNPFTNEWTDWRTIHIHVQTFYEIEMKQNHNKWVVRVESLNFPIWKQWGNNNNNLMYSNLILLLFISFHFILFYFIWFGWGVAVDILPFQHESEQRGKEVVIVCGGHYTQNTRLPVLYQIEMALVLRLPYILLSNWLKRNEQDIWHNNDLKRQNKTESTSLNNVQQFLSTTGSLFCFVLVWTSVYWRMATMI